jgi:hypothetical protein
MGEAPRGDYGQIIGRRQIREKINKKFPFFGQFYHLKWGRHHEAIMDKILARADPRENQQKVSLFRPILPFKMGEAPRGDYGQNIHTSRSTRKSTKSFPFSANFTT